MTDLPIPTITVPLEDPSLEIGEWVILLEPFANIPAGTIGTVLDRPSITSTRVRFEDWVILVPNSLLMKSPIEFTRLGVRLRMRL